MQEMNAGKKHAWSKWIVEGFLGLAVLLVLIAVGTPNLLRVHRQSERMQNRAQQGSTELEALDKLSPDQRLVSIVSSMTMLADDPFKASQLVEGMVQTMGGYVGSMERAGGEGRNAQITLVARIPKDKFDQARTEVRKFGSKIVNEKVDAQDVTAQYVDMDSTLRNYRLEEQQYLAVMKRTGNISDTLEVARQLSDVRGRIEKLEGELRLLNRQVQFASLTLSISAEPMPVANEWKPWRNARQATLDAGENLAGYVDFMVMLLVNVPLFVLWPFTLLTIGGYAWRVAVYMWKKWLGGLFVRPTVKAPLQA